MSQAKRFSSRRVVLLLIVMTVGAVVTMTVYERAWAQTAADFPEGFDAMQAAPDSHRVVFENSLVRVLEVSVPPAGKTIPMHHHRWPSFFLSWDTGGRSAHIQYHRGDGTVMEQQSKIEPEHAGRWTVRWMKPEAMHSIEVLESGSGPKPNEPTELRIEIKCLP